MEVTLGGDRLGSGNKQKLELHNYNRSTHNLSSVRRTTAAPGVLYPIYTNIGLPGDVWNIDLSTMVRTLPTQTPLFGSFKMQVDMFSVPLRLYQGILHNNPINIGLKMNQVYLPKIRVNSTNAGAYTTPTPEKSLDISNSCLLKYLGISGLGNNTSNSGTFFRDFNATPVLAYYDIFKNYYANKQEEKYLQIEGQLFTGGTNYSAYKWELANVYDTDFQPNQIITHEVAIGTENMQGLPPAETGLIITNTNIAPIYRQSLFIPWGTSSDYFEQNASFIIKFLNETEEHRVSVKTLMNMGIMFRWKTKSELGNNEGGWYLSDNFGFKVYQFYPMKEILPKLYLLFGKTGQTYLPVTDLRLADDQPILSNDISLTQRDLSEIDEMRNYLLSQNELGTKIKINDGNFKFIQCITETTDTGISKNMGIMNGLVCKTYQSDLFNNWVQTEWIDGENGINEISSVAVVDGSFTMDALNLAKKVYNMLNRVAVSGGTYQDWQEAVYTHKAVRKAETPIYCGSLSSEITFEEVVSTGTDEQPLGTLAGKGTQSNVKGGKITIDVEEPSIIMGILSITPRLDYSQGNEWYMTELDTIDDLHKPALDGIGFQDLDAEQMAWWAVNINAGNITKFSVGKTPAWINYMTDVNKLYGEFCERSGAGTMVLTRDYTRGDSTTPIHDMTTYIEPDKYNYAFAYQDLAAQNFWVQVGFNIQCRRIMSAKQIPNL